MSEYIGSRIDKISDAMFMIGKVICFIVFLMSKGLKKIGI